MNIRWRPGRLGVLCITAAAIAVAAVPATPPPSTSAVAARAVERPRLRAAPPEAFVVQLDMERLRRLQPARDDAASIATASRSVADEGVADVEQTEGPMTPTEEPVATQEDPAKVEIVNAFATKSWYVQPPPPPPPKPVPPPKPTAPPLPFAFVGRYENPGAPAIILLLLGDRLYTVTEGDSIDGIYRVDRVEKGRVELTYLPLKQKQVLQTGEPG